MFKLNFAKLRFNPGKPPTPSPQENGRFVAGIFLRKSSFKQPFDFGNGYFENYCGQP